MDPLAVVRIQLADSAPVFVAAAIDLLCEVENADDACIPDDVIDAAKHMRAVIERGGW